MNKIGKDIPWDYRNERDVRTLVSFNPKFKKETPFNGIEHHGIDDCKHQIKYCVATYNSLNIDD